MTIFILFSLTTSKLNPLGLLLDPPDLMPSAGDDCVQPLAKVQ